MKNTALFSSLAILLVLILFILFWPKSEKSKNTAAKQKADSSKKQNFAPKQNKSRTFQSLKKKHQSKKENDQFYVRSRARQALDTAGRVVYLSAPKKLPKDKKTADIVIDLLKQRDVDKGYTPEDFTDAVVSSQHVSKHNGVTHIYIRQRIEGIEVYNGDINANVASDGTVLSAHNRFVKDLRSEINRTEPVLPALKAIRSAAIDLGVLTNVNVELKIEQTASGPALETIYEGGKISKDPIPVKLMYLPQPDNKTRLVWNLAIHLPQTSKWMDVNVDAETGKVLSKTNWYAHADYNVYPLPFETPLDGSRQTVTDAHNPTASPFGWHDTNGVTGAEFTDTRGNNVNAQDDIDANNTGGSRPDGGAALSFDNPIDLSQAPDTYRDGAITNLFYWNNILHDIYYQYGFDEAAGNFQENNYGNGGIGSDPVEADAQDGSGTNNANFGTPPDGFNPRMQMFIWTGANPDRDSDLDNVIIIHEYGHGVSNRLTGGAANSSALSADQSRGMGEGWSDWWGLVLTAKPSQVEDLSRTVGYYVLGQPTTGGGIRPRPYTTNMAVNEFTYGDLPSSGLSVPHGIGFVWCTTLWEIYWNLVNHHGFDADFYNGSGGNNIALQLIMDGLKLQPATPTYLEARDAILLADQINNSGANHDLIWAAFAKRGMGFSASDSGDPNDLNVTEAFDVPDEQFSINDVAVTETDSGTVNATFTVTLNPPAVETTTVNYATVDGTATSPADYISTSGQLSFATGESSKTITVSVLGENVGESDETFSVQLSNAVNGIILDGMGIGTIHTDDFIPPLISSSLNATAVIGNNFNYQITAQNTPTSFSIVSAPLGMTIDNNTGLISWIPSATGNFTAQISATNPAGTDTRALNIVVLNDPIQEAIDFTLPITNGTPPWFSQSVVTQDGVDAAQSALITHNETTSFQTTVTGPDTLRFWWKVSSESNFDYLNLFDNGTLVTSIDGEIDWHSVTYQIPTGTHTLEWQYLKDGSVSIGDDAGWVDLVSLDSQDPRPVILSDSVAVGVVNQPFSHQIDTTHPALTFSATSLPAGLSLNTSTGLISGTPSAGGITNLTLTTTNASGSDTQAFKITIQDPSGLANALGTSKPITTSEIPWFPQSTTTFDGIEAVQSGAIVEGQSTWFEIPVSGPDSVSFWWKVSSENGQDFLRLLDDGIEITSISGEEDWRQFTYDIPSGSHTLRWEYSKDAVIDSGLDTAWVDVIEFASEDPRPLIISSPTLTALENIPVTFQIETSQIATSFSSTPLPFGLSLNTSTGQIIGTPTYTGTAQASITATNSAGSDTLEMTFIVETPATLPFSEDFESGNLAGYWSIGGTGTARTIVTTEDGPRTGSYHLTMDSSESSSNSRNELDLTINLSATDNVLLSFWAKEFGDEDNGPPALPFFDGADFDGVAISEDGVAWYEIQPLRTEISSDWAEFSVDLDAAAAAHGISLGPGFKIRFNHYDNFPISSDGFSFDDISIIMDSDLPIITSASEALGVVDQLFFSHQITTRNPATSFSSSALPAGLTLNTSTGLISGSPLLSSVGENNVDITATNSHGDFTQTLTITILAENPLSEALDINIIPTTGTPPWFRQTIFTNDGIDAAQSGDINDSETSFMEISVEGPDELSFFWKVSSESSFDFLKFIDNGTEIARISGEQDWAEINHSIPAGSHILRWEYDKDGSVSTGEDAGWVDQITLLLSDPRPFITSATAVEGVVNTAFQYQITTSNPATSFSTSALPAGLTIDTATGVISGTPSVGGQFDILLTATNSDGTAETTIRISILEPTTLPFVETFESGTFGSAWTLSGTGGKRTLITSLNGPYEGNHHVTMDTTGGAGRNEMTLSIDLSQSSTNNQIELSFFAKEFGDEQHAPPSNPFQEGADFDGVAISDDGLNWYEIQPLRSEISAAWAEFTVDLSQAISTYNLNLSNNFRIRFNQYDTISIPSDGIAFDNIRVVDPSLRPTITSPTNISSPINATLSYQITTTNGANSFSATSLPAGLSIDATTGLISGSVPEESEYIIEISASNAHGTSSQLVTFSILGYRALFNLAAAEAGLQGDDALPEATPFNDGITNLERYAFNLPLDSPSQSTIEDGGNAGFPRLSIEQIGGETYWKLQYVRRLNSGVIYSPVSSTTVDGTYTAITTDPTVTTVDSSWERIEILELATEEKLFVKVEVSFPSAPTEIILEMEEPSPTSSPYHESGFTILDPVVGGIFTRHGVGSSSLLPSNGTTYFNVSILASDEDTSFELTPDDGLPFDAIQLDLAEYSTVFNRPTPITWIGYKQDGSQVNTTFNIDGIIDGSGPLFDFETFTFPPTFEQIVRLECTAELFSVDNIVLKTNR